MGADLLARWIEEESAVLARVNRGPGPGVAPMEQVSRMSGLEIMRAMLMGEMPIAHLAKQLTFGAIAVDYGVAVFQGSPRVEYLNPMGTVHGGWISSMMDSALGSAVLTVLEPGYSYTTGSLTVQYLKAVRLNLQRVRVEATVTEQAERVATAQARMLGPDGRLYAQATAKCRIFPPLR